MSGNSKKYRKERKTEINKKVKNTVLKVATIVIAVFVAVFLSILIPKQMEKDLTKTVINTDSEIEIHTKNDGLQDENLTESIEENINNENTDTEVKDSSGLVVNEDINDLIISNNTENQNLEVDLESDINEINNSETDSSLETNKIIVESDAIDDEEISDVTVSENDIDEAQYVNDEWVDEIIQENKSEISDVDLVNGSAIYNMLDTAYLFGLAEDGLTDEERAEAMAYIEANLSGDQIELAKELFNKYVGLVN